MEETIRILVVDDEPDIRRICRILLENSGYTVLEAATGLEAVETIRRCPEIDLILMDIMMPDLDGYDACSRLRACSTAPVLFLTAKTQENDKRRAYDAGGDDYLAKPFSHAELMMKVESLLRRYRVYKNKSSGRMLRPGIVLDEENRRVLLDGATANYRLTQSVPDGAETLDRPSPIVPMKAVKNAVEQENLRRAHLADGIALTRFLRWLKHDAVREGATELSAAAKLEEYRRESADYLEPSFDPILAYGPHGAIVHYEATEETDVPLEAHSLLLADTGGHYRTGTTDVTRTVALGPVAEEEKRACTLVLRGHLALAAARFRAGVTGENLDILARGPLWDEGLDYNHGTGHGVGYLLSVHEGPQRIHWSIASNARHTALEPGMIFSDEPGLYLAGKFGVRLENLLLVREAETNAYGRFLSLEPLTLAPFDRDTIDPSILSDRELAQLNAYHARVYEALAPHLDAETRVWLLGVTAPLGK